MRFVCPTGIVTCYTSIGVTPGTGDIFDSGQTGVLCLSSGQAGTYSIFRARGFLVGVGSSCALLLYGGSGLDIYGVTFFNGQVVGGVAVQVNYGGEFF